jgi:hypothetical protein
MAFQSKRLRVQLPCGERTVFEQVANVNCPFHTLCIGGSFFCDPNTCVFGEASEIGPGGLCTFPSCDFGTAPDCVGGTQVPDPGRVLVDPEHLPALRKHLEERLNDIATAERALEERG